MSAGRIHRLGWLIGAFIVLSLPALVYSQELPPDPNWLDVQKQLEEQAQQIRELQAQLNGSKSEPAAVASLDGEDQCLENPKAEVPLVTELPWSADCDESKPPKSRQLNFFVDYNKGFVIQPFDPDKYPYEAKLNGWIQFRHHAFDRDVDSWTDNAGVDRPVENRNAFDIERARIQLSGFAVNERLTYFLQLDGDTDGAHAVDFFDYWWAWQLTDALQIQLGKRKVPGSRQWLLGARRTRFIERPMANDFFRPDRTVGLFGVGEFWEGAHYEFMIGNGYSSANIPNSASDNQFTYAVTNYFEPLGAFGDQIVDYEGSSEPLLQFGHSFVFSPQAANAAGESLAEADFIRLSDGTRLTQIGALTGGVTVSDFDVYFYGVDACFKWNGFSANAEVFLRWIEDIRGNGPLTVTDLFQRGFYAEAGHFIIPKKLDMNLRYSQVTGDYGASSEYAGGVNWYPLESHKLKISFDVTQLDGSPFTSTSGDIMAGDNGTLFRTQFQAEF